MKGLKELRQARAGKIDAMAALNNKALAEERDLSAEEQTEYDGVKAEVDSLGGQIARIEETDRLQAEGRSSAGTQTQRGASNWNKLPLGDDEDKALMHWFRTGDNGGVRSMQSAQDGSVGFRLPTIAEQRAVTNSTMNITTAADGAVLDPNGFVPRVAERMSEMMLANKLPIQRIQGEATTISWPTQAADPQVLATTAEQTDAHDVSWERDALQFNKTDFTLVMKTKVLELTLQLLQDNQVDLEGHIANMIGKSVALTHNAALVTEVAANGTAFKTFASATAIAAGEPEDVVFADTLAYYLEDEGNAAWVMKPSTFGEIASLRGDNRIYAETPYGSFNRSLMGYPVYFSGSVAATIASAKSVLFGNWDQVGLYESPTLQVLRDPYSVVGMVLLKYYFRFDYGTLQAGGIGYGVHPSA